MMSFFAELRTELERYLDESQIKKIYQAYLVSEQAHAGQLRRSGEPYITHPVAAAVILSKMRMDYQSIMATLLHDVIEDTPVTKEELRTQFGSEIAELVDGVSKLTQIKFESRAEAQAENFRKMVLAMVRDIRVIIVKLADRLHNMRTMGAMPPEKKRRIAIETLEIYAPIASRLGMHNLYTELEDLGFAAIYPMRYRAIASAVKRARGNRRQLMSKIETQLRESLDKFAVPTLELYGRQKHLYSIYKKMRNKSSSFAEIMDVYGLRIITRDIDSCYRVLGAIHRTYKPVPERFKDYIGIPKGNGYQSLHTTLFGPYGVPIEIQIRTEDMDKVAINGIAAHWIYKASGFAADEAQLRAQEWIKGLLDMQQNTGSSIEFIENVKIDLFPDEVYVFTPNGDIMELPRGATAVDFAYMVHSDIGNSCVAAKINRRLSPLTTPLANGQTVEIITAPGAQPNPAWLNFVVTGKARSNIRHFLKSQQLAEAISLGKSLLNTAFTELNTSLTTVPAETMKALLQDLHYKTQDELYMAIGVGSQQALNIAKKLVRHETSGITRLNEALVIKGTEGSVVSYAECCRPIPGDPIIGYLQLGSGIQIHIEECYNLEKLKKQNNDLIALRWDEKTEGYFLVDIGVEVPNQRGALAILANSISEAEANIDNISVNPEDGLYTIIRFTLSVKNRGHLARVMRRIRANKIVVGLYRSKFSA